MPIILAVLNMVTCFAGETNKIEKIPVVKTNYTQAVSWYREVNGQLYNTQRSIRFESIEAEVKVVYGNAVLFYWTKKKPIYGKTHSDPLVSEGNFLGSASGQIAAAQRPIIGYETIFSKNILALNYPTIAASGEKVLFRAMQVGTTNFDGKPIELWDCGTPHVVPVVTTNWIKFPAQ